jgi:hypothetical protein
MEKTIKYDDLVAYLEDEDDWTRCEESNDRWLIFEGDYGTDGTPIQIVLPANDEATDVRYYLDNAVKTLAAIQGTPIEDMADLISPTSVKALMKAPCSTVTQGSSGSPSKRLITSQAFWLPRPSALTQSRYQAHSRHRATLQRRPWLTCSLAFKYTTPHARRAGSTGTHDDTQSAAGRDRRRARRHEHGLQRSPRQTQPTRHRCRSSGATRTA